MNKDTRHKRDLEQSFEIQFFKNNKQNINSLNNSYLPLDKDDKPSDKNHSKPIKLNFNSSNQKSYRKNEQKNEQKETNYNSQQFIKVKNNLITQQNTLQYSSVDISQNKYSVLSEIIDNTSLIEPYNQSENVQTQTLFKNDAISNQTKIDLSCSLASITEQQNQLYSPIKNNQKQYCFQCDMKVFQMKKILIKDQQQRDQNHRIQKTLLKKQYQQKYNQFWTKLVQKQTLILNLSNQNLNYQEQIKELNKQLEDLKRTIQIKDKHKQEQIQDIICRQQKQNQQRIKTLQQMHQYILSNLKSQIKTKQKQFEGQLLIREQQNQCKIRGMKRELEIQLLEMKSRLRAHFEERQKIVVAKLSAEYEQRIKEIQIYAEGLEKQINKAKLLIKYKNQTYDKQIQLLNFKQSNFYSQGLQSDYHKTQHVQKPQNKSKSYTQFIQLTLQSYKNMLALDNQTKTHQTIQLNQKVQIINRFYQLKQQILQEKIRQIQQANQQLQEKLVRKQNSQHNIKNEFFFSNEDHNNNSQQTDSLKDEQVINVQRQEFLHKLQISQKQLTLKTKQLNIKQNQLSIYQNTILNLQQKNQQHQKQINRLSQLLKMKQQKLYAINYNLELQKKQMAIQTQAIQAQIPNQLQQNILVKQKIQVQYQLKHQQLAYQLQQCKNELNKYKKLYQSQNQKYQQQKDSYFKHMNQCYRQKTDLIQKIQQQCSVKAQKLLQTQQKINQQTILKLNLRHQKLVNCYKQEIVQLSSIIQGVITLNHNLNRKINGAQKDFQALQSQFKHLIAISLINLTNQQ